MKRRLMDNLKLIAVLAGLFLALSGGLYKVWSVEAQVSENTYWIDEERYDRQEARIEYKLTVDCNNEGIKTCNEKDKKTIKRWRRRLKKLGKKLGYE